MMLTTPAVRRRLESEDEEVQTTTAKATPSSTTPSVRQLLALEPSCIYACDPQRRGSKSFFGFN
jgi:hypothetical protein